MRSKNAISVLCSPSFVTYNFAVEAVPSSLHVVDLVAAAEEMKRAAVDLKLPGFQIGSHVGEWNLDAKELYPIYKVVWVFPIDTVVFRL